MDDLQRAVPPRPAIRQRQKVDATVAQSINTDNKDLPQAKLASQDRQLFNDSDITRKQRELNEELVEFNKSLMNSTSNKRSQPEANGKAMLALPSLDGTKQQLPERPYPKKVLFIVVNEFCERFSFYGFRTILLLYFKSVLGFSDSNSTISFHLFAALCYITPVLGAILGDSVWGKFKTILYLSTVYFLGEFILVLSSIFWDLGTLSTLATFIGLFTIGVGTGGIKPCVSALGGDQFYPHEERRRQAFFSLFYAAINLGSLISMFITPILRSDVYCVNRQDCYPLAFGLPCFLMFVAIIVFLVAKNQYHLVPLPEQNVMVALCSCVWLALKRKLTGYKLPPSAPKKHGEPGGRHTNNQSMSDATSSSSLSVSSNEEALYGVATNAATIRPIADETVIAKPARNESQVELQSSERPKHWLYLASDRFDTKSIEDFRSVLAILLLFVPIPVYWCLYDQQGSLWTLQATRMDGRVFNTNFVLKPDQISVANPLIMITFIPLFELFIYPALTYCNLLKKPIQRMTVGGLLTALAFVLVAMIEVSIQHYEPATVPPPGRANLLLVNGLSECSLMNPVISYVPQIQALPISAEAPVAQVDKTLNGTEGLAGLHKWDNMGPLSAQSHDIISSEAALLNNYLLKFKLASVDDLSTTNQSTSSSKVGCPFSATMDFEVAFGAFDDRSAKLVYLDQGNGKLSHKIFNDSLALPPAGKARLRLLYEAFGSLAQREKRQFYLLRESSESASSSNQSSTSKQEKFKPAFSEGQVTLSDYLDVDVASLGETFLLRTSDNLLGPSSNHRIFVKPATKNLVIVHQKDNQNVDVKLDQLQDNDYRVSMLYQLGPYLLISIGEVMLSITALELCYSMAPDTMKSVIMAAWSVSTAFGNVLTVSIEAMNLFSNVVHHFLFYAAIMTVDMFVFALIGYCHVPQRPTKSSNK